MVKPCWAGQHFVPPTAVSGHMKDRGYGVCVCLCHASIHVVMCHAQRFRFLYMHLFHSDHCTAPSFCLIIAMDCCNDTCFNWMSSRVVAGGGYCGAYFHCTAISLCTCFLSQRCSLYRWTCCTAISLSIHAFVSHRCSLYRWTCLVAQRVRFVYRLHMTCPHDNWIAAAM